MTVAGNTGQLAGRKALVLGAGTAAGKAIAVALANAGAEVAVASSTTDGDEVMAVRRTRRAVEALGRRAPEYAFDTTLGQNVQVSTRQVAKELGGLDVLVVAQSHPLRQSVQRTSDSEWARSIALNLGGVFFACRAALREMSGGGVILMVIPALAEEAAAACNAAAHGVAGLAQAIAAEYADRDIRIYAVSAGSAGIGPAPSLTAAEIGAPGEIGALAVHLILSGGVEIGGQVIGAVAPAENSSVSISGD